jgi:hypothetical protein
MSGRCSKGQIPQFKGYHKSNLAKLYCHHDAFPIRDFRIPKPPDLL